MTRTRQRPPEATDERRGLADAAESAVPTSDAVERAVEQSCGEVPAGHFVVRSYARCELTEPAFFRVQCTVGERIVGEASFVAAPGLHHFDCPIVLPHPGELVVRLLTPVPPERLRLWPPVTAMRTELGAPPTPGLLELVEQVRSWSEHPERFAGAVAAQAEARRRPQSLGELKQLVFDELYRHVEHRPVPLAIARFTRRALHVLAGPPRRWWARHRRR